MGHQRVHSNEKDDRTEESEKKPEIIKRKRKSDSVLHQSEEVLTGNESSKSASTVDGKRKRKSESVLQQPEVVLSTGNDSSSSEKTEKKPKILPSPSKKPSNKQVAFSRGGYVKRRRKPKVVVQKTSSTESEDLTDSDGEISNYYLPTS